MVADCLDMSGGVDITKRELIEMRLRKLLECRLAQNLVLAGPIEPVLEHGDVPCALDAAGLGVGVVASGESDEVVFEGAGGDAAAAGDVFEAGKVGGVGVGEGEVHGETVAAETVDGVPDGGLGKVVVVEGKVPVSTTRSCQFWNGGEGGEDDIRTVELRRSCTSHGEWSRRS